MALHASQNWRVLDQETTNSSFLRDTSYKSKQ